MKPLRLTPADLIKNTQLLDQALASWPIQIVMYYPPSGMLLQRAQEYLVRPRPQSRLTDTHIEYWANGYPYVIESITSS